MPREILDWLKDLFLFLGQHPAVLIVIVLIACFTLLSGGSSSRTSNQD